MRSRRKRLFWIIPAFVVGTAIPLALWFREGLPHALRSADDANAPGTDQAVGQPYDAFESSAPPPVLGDRTHMAWSPADPDAVDRDWLPPRYQQTDADAVLVSLADDMWSWRAGDRIVISVPHTGATFESVIDRVVTSLGDNRSYVGRLVGEDQPHLVVVTVGSMNAYAHVGTPQGSYELVGNRHFGWLMPTASMDRHVDYSKPDYIILPNDTLSQP